MYCLINVMEGLLIFIKHICIVITNKTCKQIITIGKQTKKWLVFLFSILVYFADCPPGYTGYNCSEVCPSPYYGLGCTHTCNCSECQHISGCISTTDAQDGTLFTFIKLRIVWFWIMSVVFYTFLASLVTIVDISTFPLVIMLLL